jgi:hypothetical protein
LAEYRAAAADRQAPVRGDAPQLVRADGAGNLVTENAIA